MKKYITIIVVLFSTVLFYSTNILAAQNKDPKKQEKTVEGTKIEKIDTLKVTAEKSCKSTEFCSKKSDSKMKCEKKCTQAQKCEKKCDQAQICEKKCAQAQKCENNQKCEQKN